jgi:hypothetical protein
MRLAFMLDGSSDPAKVRVTVLLAKGGRGGWDGLVSNTSREGNVLRVMNAQVTLHSVVAKRARVSIRTYPDLLVTGSSGGVLTTTRRPAFLQ